MPRRSKAKTGRVLGFPWGRRVPNAGPFKPNRFIKALPGTTQVAFSLLAFCLVQQLTAQEREAQIGYVYPAGGRQGSTFQVVAGGQFIQNADEVFVSGEGVTAYVIKSIRPINNLNNEQRWILCDAMLKVWEQRLKEAGARSLQIKDMRERMLRRPPWNVLGQEKLDLKGEVMPPHYNYILEGLEKKSLRELMHANSIIFFPRDKLQLNRQLAEYLLIGVEIARDAPVGDRRLRIKTRQGLTRPLVFQVSELPEVSELEPNDEAAYEVPQMARELVKIFDKRPLDLPVVLNGQIMPGDVDRFRFRAKEGQKLVIEANARRLIPYLADAVPGWFQATLALYDSDGKEVAFADDYRFNPDPVMFFKVPRDGEYELEIRDAIYRGRQDFVYRVSVGERPFVTAMFPLGGQVDQKVTAKVEGWNLPRDWLLLDTRPGLPDIRETGFREKNRISNTLPYAVDLLPDQSEREPNDLVKSAQRFEGTLIVNGRIDKPGDIDLFGFEGRAGQTLVAEVQARCLGSPVDSLLRLLDGSGKVLVWNDDHVLKEQFLHVSRFGLLTHHADAYVIAALPHDGPYYIQISDAQQQGGSEYAYRLRMGAPQHDFALLVEPSTILAIPGRNTPIGIHALRKDGFDGEIAILVDPESGFKLTGGHVMPPGCSSLRMTLCAVQNGEDHMTEIKLFGRAQLAGREIVRAAIPVENVMQAFLYRHLVPEQDLKCFVRRQKFGSQVIEYAANGPVELVPGGSAGVHIGPIYQKDLNMWDLRLDEPPDGVSIKSGLQRDKGGARFELELAKDAKSVGYRGNLIVEAFRSSVTAAAEGKPARKNRWSHGYLPAIPIRIVPQ